MFRLSFFLLQAEYHRIALTREDSFFGPQQLQHAGQVTIATDITTDGERMTAVEMHEQEAAGPVHIKESHSRHVLH